MKISGEKGIVYIDKSEAPQRSSWTINVTRELREARVFSNDSGVSWTEQGGGYMSWDGSADGYYDDSDESLVTYSHGSSTARWVTLYESRFDTSTYWYGQAWIDMSETAGADNFVDFNITLNGTGPLARYAS